jgi:hypothetical protein
MDMMSLEAMEQPCVVFLYELYKRSAGDPRQGVSYEELVDALGFCERVTKQLQRALQQEGLVELTAVPPMTRVGRTVMDSAHRRSPRQNIGMPPHGVQLIEDILAHRALPDSPTPSTAPSSWTSP